MKLWRVMCLEDKFPGMWHRWYRHQAVGLGWPPDEPRTPKMEIGWNVARRRLEEIQVGDAIVVALRGRRLGRLGYITGKEVTDEQWNPLVPVSTEYPYGDMGRRILVRWDLTVGPDNRDLVVALPKGLDFSRNEMLPTISCVRSLSFDAIKTAMNDSANWVGLLSFRYERALSEYIAAYPHRLEDGMLPHPNEKVREKVFDGGTRSDVLLMDRKGISVIVECKQDGPTAKAVDQLRGYMDKFHELTREKPRGVLVHGGARKLPAEVSGPNGQGIEFVQYELNVDFNSTA